ncbi:MAG: hypothetical protein SPK87_04030, partial [Bacteroidales bacterium]|nr:hypothetical protein [Bacteroidales bacterium]
MMYSSQDLMLSLSLVVYLTTCAVVAAVRWEHKCLPYAEHVDYNLPGWRALVFGALSNLALRPVVFKPQGTHPQQQVRQ